MSYRNLALGGLMFGTVAAAGLAGCSDDDGVVGNGGSSGEDSGGTSAGEGGSPTSTAGGGTGGTDTIIGGVPNGGSAGAGEGGTPPSAGGEGGMMPGPMGGAAGEGGGGATSGAAGGEGGMAGGGVEGGAGGQGPDGPCAPALAEPTVPDAIKVTDSAVLVAVYGAVGVQKYTCTQTGSGESATYAWSTASVPTATLRNAECDVVGDHYAGPRWRSVDGSIALGVRVADATSAAPSSIAQLLLSATAEGTTGIFSPVTAIQRLDTVGGVAPATGCTALTVATTVDVPYTANYYFYSGANIIPSTP